jgi:dolichyl-phosphate-mannose--protein O-mannosyl transferase
VRTVATIAVSFAVVWVLGLWLLDLRFSVYHTPWDHLRYMLRYGLSLTSRGSFNVDFRSQPWQWLANRVQVTYLRTGIRVLPNGRVAYARAAYFRGAMNPVIIWGALLAIPYAAWRFWKHGDKIALWVVVWFGANYLPFYPLAIVAHRISYIYYFLPSLPAVAAGLALVLRRAGLPRVVVWGYLLAVLAGFIVYFPFHNLF